MAKADYPYTGKQGECQYKEESATFKNTGMMQERYMSNEKLKALVNKQPVTAGIVVTEAFRAYNNGIMTEEFLACSDEKMNINQAITIVGFGKTDKTMVASTWCSEFWIARNSWGSSWGEQGFFRLCMDNAGRGKTPYGTCQINRFPSYPIIE
jgi:cathepsin H